MARECPCCLPPWNWRPAWNSQSPIVSSARGILRKYGSADTGTEPPDEGIWIFDHSLGDAPSAVEFGIDVIYADGKIIMCAEESQSDNADIRALSPNGQILWSVNRGVPDDESGPVFDRKQSEVLSLAAIPDDDAHFYATRNRIGSAIAATMKLKTSDGSVVWEVSITGAAGLAARQDGSFCTVGFGTSTPGGIGSLQVFDPDGERLWSAEGAHPLIAVTSDELGNVFAAGIDSTLSGSLVKYDPDGNLLWSFRPFPNDGLRFLRAVATDDSGNVYCAGDVGVDGNRLWCLNSNGNIVWGNPSGGIPGTPSRMKVSGGCIFLTTRNAVGHHALACLSTGDGSLLWSKDWGSTSTPMAGSSSVSAPMITPGGDLYAIGSTAIRNIPETEE